MTEHNDQLEQLLQGWGREQVRTAPEVAPLSAARLQPAVGRQRVRALSAVAVVAAGIVAVGGLILLDSGSSTDGHQAVPVPTGTVASSSADPSSSRRPSRTPPVAVPSPTSPAFGTCGGLRSVADARDIVVGGEAVAIISATVEGEGARLPVSGDERALPVSDVQLLAGRLPDGTPSTVDSQPLRAGRYLLVLGENDGEYYPALGPYGVYAIRGPHAYRTCYLYRPSGGVTPRQVRSGITTIRGLTRLFGRALR